MAISGDRQFKWLDPMNQPYGCLYYKLVDEKTDEMVPIDKEME